MSLTWGGCRRCRRRRRRQKTRRLLRRPPLSGGPRWCGVRAWLLGGWYTHGGGGVSGGGSKMRGDNGDATNNNRREHTCGGDWVGKGDRAGVGHGDVRGSLYFGRLLRMSEGGHEKDSYVEGVHLFERRQRREDKTGEQRETWVASARCYSQHCVVTGTTTRDALYLQYLIG